MLVETVKFTLAEVPVSPSAWTACAPFAASVTLKLTLALPGGEATALPIGLVAPRASVQLSVIASPALQPWRVAVTLEPTRPLAGESFRLGPTL
jgi:hypothetical protein